MPGMRRREFVSLFGGAAATWPLAARAQQPKKVPRIGLLVATNASAWAPRITAFVQRLRQLGWIEGQTVAIEYRWAEGQYDRFAEIAAEFVRLKVDVIVTAATAPALSRRSRPLRVFRLYLPYLVIRSGAASCKSGQTRWKRHRFIASTGRSWFETIGTVARDSSRSSSAGDHRQCE